MTTGGWSACAYSAQNPPKLPPPSRGAGGASRTDSQPPYTRDVRDRPGCEIGGWTWIGLTLADAVIWVIPEVQIGTAAFVAGRYGGQARPTGRVDADS